MNRALGNLCTHIGQTGPGEPPEYGEMNGMTEAPHNTGFHTWMEKSIFCFFQTAETENRAPDSGVKGSGANHYPRAPALPAL